MRASFAGREVPICVAVLLAVWAGFWWPVLVDGELLYIRDLVFFALPAKHYLAERLAAGELPLWTPHVSAGMPFLADAANQVFYPFNALLLVMSPARAVSAFGVLHSVVAMLGAFALSRALGVRPVFALWAALVYGLSGYVVSITDNLNYLAGAAWLPLALAGHVAALRSGTVRGMAVAALAVAMMLLAGDALAAGMASGCAALLSLVAVCESRRAAHDRSWSAAGLAFGAWLAMTAGGALLAAAQVLPTLMMLESTARAGGIGLSEATQFSLPPGRLLELVHPYLLGAKYPALQLLAPDAYPLRGTPWAASIHVGLLPVLAALLATALRPRRAWPWLLLALVFALLALGRHTPLYALAHEWLPTVDAQRFPEKLVLGLTLVIAMLAALGAEAALDGPLARRLSRLAYLLAAAAVLLVGFVLSLWWPVRALLGESAREASFFFSDLFGAELSHMQGLTAHGGAVCALLVAALALHAWRPRVAFAVLAVLSVAGLARVNGAAAPTAPPRLLALDERAAVLDALPALRGSRILYAAPGARAGSQSRLETLAAHFASARAAVRGGVHLLEVVRRSREGLALNDGTRFGVDYANGLYSPLQPRVPAFLERVLLAEDPARYVALTSVDYVMASPLDRRWDASSFEVLHDEPAADLRVLRPLHSPPRALLVPNALPFAAPVEAAREVIFAGHDFREQVILDPSEGELPAAARQPLDDRASVTLSRPGAERIEAAVDSPYPQAWLRVDESWAPGWSARVDGEPVFLRRADFRAMAVAVPAGVHRVSLAYETPGLTTGLVASACGVLLVLLAAWRGGRWRAKPV